MDKIMNMLRIEMVELLGKDVKRIVHSNMSRRPIGGGKCTWLTTLRRYALKLNLTIDDIWWQLSKELEAIKEALDVGFEYIDFLFGYKHVKDQVIVVLKSRRGWLKKKIKKGESRPQNCIEPH